MIIKPISFEVRGLRLKGLEFSKAQTDHDGNAFKSHHQPVVLALHGWLDNANSFLEMGKSLALANVRVLAIDLAGQGMSDHRPLSATYHLWDDAVDIVNILDQLQIDKCFLLGHSRGAMIATMIATAYSDRVEGLIALDGLLPVPVDIHDTVKQFRRFTEGFQHSKTSRRFDSYEQAIEVRAKVSGMDMNAVEVLAERGLRHHADDTYSWWVDERLKVASAVKMLDEHNHVWLRELDQSDQPVLVILAEQGLSQLSCIQRYQNQYPNFLWVMLKGGHHQHMQHQHPEVARLCVEFLNTKI